MSARGSVRDHFDADAQRFDAIYDPDKGPIRRFVDDRWRGVVQRRLEVTLEKVAPVAGQTFLDVGTGSGRFCLAYAERGAERAVGIDFAPAMIDIANSEAKRLGVGDRCEFLVGAFSDDLPAGTYDAVTAMGFFDYVPDAAEMARAMAERSRHRVLMSFPKSREWRVPIRRARFMAMRCPLYLYGEDQVRNILSAAGLNDYEWIDLGRDYFISATV